MSDKVEQYQDKLSERKTVKSQEQNKQEQKQFSNHLISNHPEEQDHSKLKTPQIPNEQNSRVADDKKQEGEIQIKPQNQQTAQNGVNGQKVNQQANNEAQEIKAADGQGKVQNIEENGSVDDKKKSIKEQDNAKVEEEEQKNKAQENQEQPQLKTQQCKSDQMEETQQEIPQEQYLLMLQQMQDKKAIDQENNVEGRQNFDYSVSRTRKVVKKKIVQIVSNKKQNLQLEQPMKEWFLERIDYLNNFDTNLYWNITLQKALAQFLYKQEKIFIWVQNEQCQFNYSQPEFKKSQFCQFIFFIKFINSDNINITDADQLIFYKVVQSNYLKSLLSIMNGTFIPMIVQDQGWPQNVKKEFMAQLHKFMATITQLSYQQQGFTQLYIPRENFHKKDSQDKDLVQRLDSIMMHWNKQIKEIVSSTESQHDSQNSGPLDEIYYWRSRRQNLKHIDQQLQKHDLKEIVDFLHRNESSNVKTFEQVTKNIKSKSLQASNNLLFLESLYEPCKTLESTNPKQIPQLLPSLLIRVRMIWQYSKNYNTNQRISGLLHKISNEIIKRCKAQINVSDMLDGDVEKCIVDLKDSIQCCQKWKNIYQKTSKIINAKKTTQQKWDFRQNSIFAQIDAFIQRCSQLIQICQGQLQFAMRGSDTKIPCFGGSNAPQIVNILLQIKGSFSKLIQRFRQTQKQKILDVKTPNWHDQYSNFKSGMKDLDVMYQNIIVSAFDMVTTVEQGVQMLQAFDYLAKRDSIKSCLKRRADYVMNLFISQVQHFKYETIVNRKMFMIPLAHGYYSGHAIWARSLMFRIENMKNAIDKLVFVDDSIKKNAHLKYYDVYKSNQAIVKQQQISKWRKEYGELEEDIACRRRIETNTILCLIEEVNEQKIKNMPEILKPKKGHLQSNFDRQLLKFMHEILAWKSLISMNVKVPMEFTDQNYQYLRILREYALIVVRDYNMIIDFMDETEKKLFAEHLQNLNKNIEPGITRFKWSSKSNIDSFLGKTCKNSCAELYAKLKMFKNNTQKIQQKCQQIAIKPFLSVNKKKLYQMYQFEEQQLRHREFLSSKFREIFDSIYQILCQTYQPFIFSRRETQKIWLNYVQSIDKKIIESFRKAIKNSLLDFSKIIGDKQKNIKAIAIFKLSVELDRTQTPKIIYNPSTQQLKKVIILTLSRSNEIVKEFKTMQELMVNYHKLKKKQALMNIQKQLKNPLMQKHQQLKSFQQIEQFNLEFMSYESKASDYDIQKYTKNITENLGKVCNDVNNEESKNKWINSQLMWESKKQQKYNLSVLEGNQNISEIRQIIQKFQTQIEQINHRIKSHSPIQCIVLDNTNFKKTLVNIAVHWQQTFLHSLQQKCIQELYYLHSKFNQAQTKLAPNPIDLHQLKQSLDFWKECMQKKDKFESRLKPLRQKLAELDSHNIQLKDEETKLRINLQDAWLNFNQMLARIELRNKKTRTQFHSDTMKGLQLFIKETGDIRTQFGASAPFQSSYSNQKAFTILYEFEQIVKNYRAKWEEMKFGFNLFNITENTPVDLEKVDKEIVNLKGVWELKAAWDKFYAEEVSFIKFRLVNQEDLEDKSDDFFKDLKRACKQDNMRKWDIVTSFKNNIDVFKSVLPLIKSLRQPYMRSRHWDQLQKVLGQVIDPDSDDFTFDQIYVKKNFLGYADSVTKICEVAREEYKIQSALDKVKTKWESLELQMQIFKKTYKIKGSDAIFGVLQDHMGILSSQKTGLYYDSFKDEIEEWETKLQIISDTLQLFLQVQRQWIYLQAIFASQSQQDIERQLIGDISKFQAINNKVTNHMERIFQNRNAVQALLFEGFFIELEDLKKRLDQSQKILFSLLQRKRKDFPRFYFLSNDDLFELLGNSKDPHRVNKHIKKCFEGIKKLGVESLHTGKRGLELYQVLELISPEEQKVELNSKVPCQTGVQNWLKSVQKQMRQSLKKIMTKCYIEKPKNLKDYSTKNIENWIDKFQGQLLLTCCQIHWTFECENALKHLQGQKSEKPRNAWKFKEGEANFINECTKLMRISESRILRMKLVSLITIQIHAKDIIDGLVKTCNNVKNFDWQKQLRFYKTEQGDLCQVSVQQTNTKFPYGFQYQGNNGRLVVTSLTDRCYITLTTAMHLKKGGAPQGPAGTGKTQTVKDLGKGMAKFVLVFNCSQGLDIKSIGKMFSGLMQSGGWGCFDQFNRIQLEVLSVVAQQMLSILNALRQMEIRIKNKTAMDLPFSFLFEGDNIPGNDQCSIFITMNPGYAGRSQLPDNLKSLFRPISMMVPQSAIICEIMLSSQGFKYSRNLSIKIVTLYSLMTQQLSKQDHYDFGLRAVKSVLTCAGAYRRKKKSKALEPQEQMDRRNREAMREIELKEQATQQLILMQAIRDMNIPKFVAEDIQLFNALLYKDLFSNLQLQDTQNSLLEKGIQYAMKQLGLVIKKQIVKKVIQLYDSKNTRHGNMLVGQSMSGKSTCWKVLEKAMNFLSIQNKNQFSPVKLEVLNPKTISLNQLFGFVDQNTMEWSQGVLSSMMARLCKTDQDAHFQRWMILDGPVDTLWIQSMNTVLDDNKVLTLLNGDRISLPFNMGLIFEVQDLAVASPATVSRAGMIFLNIDELGWRPYIQSWIMKIKDETIEQFLSELVQRYIVKILNKKHDRQKNAEIKQLVQCLDLNIVISFTKLFDGFVSSQSAYLSYSIPNKNQIYWNLLQKEFTYCIIWSLGATLDQSGRRLFDLQIRDIENMFPHANTVFDYYINFEKNQWLGWEQKLSSSIWKPAPNAPFHKMLVPTIDTSKNKFVLLTCVLNKINSLSIGITGTGKTVLINEVISDLDQSSWTSMNIIFSSQTSSSYLQGVIEGRLKKRAKNKLVPDGMKMVIYCDDLNMPKKDQFGSQPALQLIRQWMDYNGWFDRTNRQLFMYVLDIQFIGSMGPPGGGRNQISKRLQSKFNIINFTFPSQAQVRRIFQSILSYKFQEFDNEYRPMAETIAQATLQLYLKVIQNFLPTPAKSHYVFNMRDISKVIQGVYIFDKNYCDSKNHLLRLWVHECLRVFHDRLVSEDDRIKLKKLVGQELQQMLNSNMKECTNENQEDTIFVDFVQQIQSGKTVYIQVPYSQRQNLINLCKEQLEIYNDKFKRSTMKVVLFQEAVSYICKIHRIIKLGKGHGMMIGQGGSGRQSLIRLSTWIASYQLCQIEITKNFKLKDFRERIKQWTIQIIKKDRPCVFMFSDTQITNQSFVEDINTILTIGELPNLYTKQELINIKDRSKKLYFQTHSLTKETKVSDQKIIDFFHSKIQNMFHIALSMSQTGDNLRNYCRMYPGLVNNTTMIWFMSWPGQALIEVANKYLKEIELEQQQRKNISTFFCNVHTKAVKYSHQMFNQLKRLYYVTPTHYVELVKGYEQLLRMKRQEIGSEIIKLGNGLGKLEEAQTNSNEIQKTLALLQNQLSKKTKDCDQLVIKIERETRDSNQKKNQVSQREILISKEKIEVKNLAQEAQNDLDKALPDLLNAEEQLKNLTRDKLTELKSFSAPPQGVDTVLNGIMILLGKQPNWTTAKKQLADTNFLQKLEGFQKDKVSTKTLHKLQKLTSDPTMTLKVIDNKSAAAGGMWRWVLAIQAYAKAHKDIEPKRAKVNSLRQKLKKSEQELENLRENFQRLQKQLQELSETLAKTQSDKKNYEEQAQSLQKKLERAQKLINGLASTKLGWEQRKKKMEQKYIYLIGDALMSAAFLSYAGPFPSQYREKLVQHQLLGQVKHFKIPFSRDYSFAQFLIKPVIFIKWGMKGLPDDQFSRQNSVLVTKGRMYPLIIDPQQQGNKWIRQMEKEKSKQKLIIMDPQSQNISKNLKTAIANGNTVIFQNVEEQIDNAIEPLLNKNIKKLAGKLTIYLGEEPSLYNQNFRFYMTTKLPNPRYKAQISTKVTLVNFAVKERGLQQQLNSVVIHKMEQNLQNNKNQQISKKSENQQLLKKLDDDILRRLGDTQGSLIDDQDLIIALDASKQTEEKVRHQIESSITQMKKIETARKNYLRLATVASKLFFIINDFNLIDHMYQFSLDSYIQLFGKIIKEYIEKPGLNDALDQKLDAIADKHRQAVYRYACRGLFEKDKLLLGLMMTVRLMDIDIDQYNFFLRNNGDLTVDRKGQPMNPNEWISEQSWNIICDLEKMPNFSGIIGAFTHNAKQWHRWYKAATPQKQPLPGQWNQKCDPLKKMIIVKAIRRDRVLLSATNFIIQKHGGSQFFVTPPPFSLQSVYNDSNKTTPIIFILSPGVDPHTQLQQFSKLKGGDLIPVSLGQGQAKKARDKVFEGAKSGSWLYLANCHLSLFFLKELEKVLQYLQMNKNEVKQNFRLWLSTNPHPKFPISILQKCVKITTQPPKGVKSNMSRLYFNIQKQKFNGIVQGSSYKKLLFSLCWFHSILIQRKRFKSLGWNTIYDFNDSDWETADKILRLYVELSIIVTQTKKQIPLGGPSTQPPVTSIVPPWQAIKYLISQVTYGGRVTDQWDRRLLSVYANQCFNQKVLNEEKHRLGDEQPSVNPYFIPEQLTAKQKALEKEGQVRYYYKQITQNFPTIQTPEAFGQHINAQISSQISDTNILIQSITSLQPKIIGLAGQSIQSKVKSIIKQTLDKVDQQINIDQVYDKIKLSRVDKSDETPNALKVVLVQEISRYNKVLNKVRKSLINLDLGISGFVLISQQLQNIMQCMFDNKVPDQWKFAYYSLKPLGSWIDDLHKRIDQLKSWADKGQPPNLFWISGFCFPTGFTTALKQQASRNQGVSIDKFYWQFSFQKYDTVISQPASIGAYIEGLFLQGAKWDGDKNCIIQPEPMRLYYPMPIIQFKPVNSEGGKQRVKKGQSLYQCPCYSYPIRGGVTQRPSYMLTVSLPCKPNPNQTTPSTQQQFWVKRGTALLMSLGQ